MARMAMGMFKMIMGTIAIGFMVGGFGLLLLIGAALIKGSTP